MASTLTAAVNVLQAAFSAYNLYLSSICITKLQKYEEKSEKAAEWSNTAAKQLHKTRTTQASGTAAVCPPFLCLLHTNRTLKILCSFVSSVAVLFYSSSTFSGLAVALVNVVALTAARAHVGEFWKGKAKIPLPGTGDYNDAISITQEIRLNSAYLAASWCVAGVLSLFLR